eukprot:1479577-Prymnesium_polylepis.1
MHMYLNTFRPRQVVRLIRIARDPYASARPALSAVLAAQAGKGPAGGAAVALSQLALPAARRRQEGFRRARSRQR